MSNRGMRAVALAVSLAGLAVAACGPFRTGRNIQDPILLVFHNDGLDQAAVYITATGIEFRRIGTVFPGHADTLQVPADIAARGTVNILASVFGRNMVPSTGPVSLSPGDVYDVTLSSDGRVLSLLPGK